MIPAFLTERLQAQYGAETAARIAEGYAAQRAVTLRANTLKATPEQVAQVDGSYTGQYLRRYLSDR